MFVAVFCIFFAVTNITVAKLVKKKTIEQMENPLLVNDEINKTEL